MLQKLKLSAKGGPATGWKTKLSRGSILVVSLIILGLMLVSALSFSLVSIQERKASMGANDSNRAFQTASTGVELVMQAIKDNSSGTLGDLASAVGGCDGSGFITGSNFKIQLQDSDGTPINCNDNTKDVALVRSIKSIGTIGGNQRAVEVAVAQEGCKTIEKMSGYNSSGSGKKFSVSCDSGCVITNYGRYATYYAGQVDQYAGWLFYYKSSAIGSGQWNDVESLIGGNTLTMLVASGDYYAAIIKCEPSL